MKLDSLRELLIKKVDDPYLRSLIKYMRDDVLEDYVAESLEKMAVSQHKARNANHTTRSFATEMDPEHEPNMIHDALSHHVSHYKAAAAGGNQHVANQHAKQAFKIMNMAAAAAPHSEGKLNINYVDPKPWERHGKTNTDDNGKFKTDTKGLNYEGNDFSWLQQAPHESYSKDQTVRTHNKAYPFEHTQINGRHVDVQDLADAGKKYVPHEFDSHPILNHFKDPAKNRTAESHDRYLNELEGYNNEHLPKYFERHEQMESADPESYKKRGAERSSQVHADVAPLEIAAENKKQEEAPAKVAPASITRKKEAPKQIALNDPHAMYQTLIDSKHKPEEAKQLVSSLLGQEYIPEDKKKE